MDRAVLPSCLRHQAGRVQEHRARRQLWAWHLGGVAGALGKLQIQAQIPADGRDPRHSALKSLTNGRKLTPGEEWERAGYLRRGTGGLN